MQGRDIKLVESVTRIFTKKLSEQTPGITFEPVFPEKGDLDIVASNLQTGNDYELAVVWGIEYGLLKETVKDLEVICVGSTMKVLLPTSSIIVRNPILPIANHTDKNPFRVHLIDGGSMIAEMHFKQLEVAYGDKVRRAEKPEYGAARQVGDLIDGILNEDFDGLIIDEYNLLALQQDFPQLLQGCAVSSDWGNVKPAPTFPHPALIGRRSIVEDRSNGSWQAISSHLFEVMNKTRAGERFREGWYAQQIVPPSESYDKQVTEKLNLYRPLISF